jgi:type II secretory pathway component PulM
MASRPAVNAATGGETNIRIVATETAREMGVAVTRLNPAENDGLSIWLDGTEPTLLFRWLLRLREEHGIAVWRASIHKGEGNLLQAEFTLGGDQP